MDTTYFGTSPFGATMKICVKMAKGTGLKG